LDLNGFKEINDTHGHTADDALLKAFAKEFRGQFRALDVVGWWGGDEFVVLLDGPAADARIRVDGVHRWVFGEYPLRGGVRVTIDAAVGMTVFRRGFIYVL